MKVNVSCLVVASIMSSGMGRWKSSFGHAWFKSLKSTHTLISPFIFRTRKMFDSQVGYNTSRMNPTLISLLTSASMNKTSFGRNLLRSCITGLAPFSTAWWCTATFGSSCGISVYVHTNKSRNSVSKAMYSASLAGVRRALTYVGRGCSEVPKLTYFNSSTIGLTCSSNPGGVSIASSGDNSSSSMVMCNEESASLLATWGI
ncbi:hypothetical protein LIER_00483 [Lithospermum erythrorhizon]|uniref:Secreted protein n=1 Tax=Lithospermum erythrorhizon TaxID=34254 RepID=A0AAV3NHH9_LITER